MPYIIRDTTNLKHSTDPEKIARAQLWQQFQERTKREGRPLAWVIWTLIQHYVTHGLD